MTTLLKKRLSLALLLLATVWLAFYSHHTIAKQAQANDFEPQLKPLRIAVAANFAPALEHLLKDLPNNSKINYQIISAATGTLYQQIKHGAPFDLFLAADNLRPTKLEQEQLILPNSRQTYAFGQLALWSATEKINNLNKLNNFSGYLAIANPSTAPYGKAAQQALQSLSLWSKLENRVVTGININQTFQQVRSQAVPIGIVALSQLKINQLKGITIPAHYYQPIAQQLVILKNSKQLKHAQQISDFLLQEITQAKLKKLGYLPGKNINSQGAL
ncbi:molybdate ABC transporter substrate-binding protein [Cognaticolwellia mytili]|uniref:molybdate ABC transporter substrate-binding protein n=1 Tax=Cognaticolwellia mytili TaxID=1888913 RepID=UPI000A175D0F|nr:molybdate ABC transporter substrate-binding protein [Cognaticolwellia mytili]